MTTLTRSARYTARWRAAGGQRLCVMLPPAAARDLAFLTATGRTQTAAIAEALRELAERERLRGSEHLLGVPEELPGVPP